jgi:N-methylhydantoinase A
MVRAIKAVTTYRGRDPRDFALVAFGGNGGVHGVGIAQSLDIRRVVVPPAAGVFSAVGLLLAEKSVTVLRAFSSDLARLDQAMADKVFDELRAEATRLLDIRQDRIDDRLQAEMRYVGQAFEITVDLKTARAIDLDPSILRARFDQEYEQRFGHSFGADKPVEIVTLKLVARDRAHKPLNTLSLAAMAPPETVRSVWFGTEFGRRETPVIGRGALTGEAQAGPLIVEEYEGTTVVPPDASASVDEISNIIIELGTSS